MAKRLSARTTHNENSTHDHTELTATDIDLGGGEYKRALDVFFNGEINASVATGASAVKITNLALDGINESSLTLQTNLKQLSVAPRDPVPVRIAFTTGETDTNYVSIPAGCSLELDDINFSGKVFYAKSDNATTLEITELY